MPPGTSALVRADNAFYVRVSGAWQMLWRASTSPMVQRGAASVPFSGTAGSLAIAFPVPFGGNPAVTVTVTGTAQWSANTSARGTAGFTINTTRPSGTGTGFVTVDWIAVF